VDRDFIERVREATNIVDVVSDHVTLKKSGKSLKGLCPFHRDKAPSFYVNPEKGVYHCFGCGAGGNVFRFVMDLEHLSFPEAVKQLAKKANIPIPAPVRDAKVSMLHKAVDMAVDFYHQVLLSPAGKRALEYLEGRKIDDETIAKFKIGYAPGGGKALIDKAKRSNLEPRFLVEAGVAMRAEDGDVFDYMRDRIVFPTGTSAGTHVGFGGRGVAQNAIPKYINSPETKLYRKRELLYGLAQAKTSVREKREVLLCEGYMDVIMLHQAGYTNAVAPLGTALTAEQSKLLSRFAKRAIIAFDGDEAGTLAAKRSVPVLLKEEILPTVACLSTGEDPASLVERGKKEEMERHFEEGLDVVSFYLRGFQETDDPARTSERAKELVSVLSVMERGVDLGVYLGILSKRTGIAESWLRHELTRRREIKKKGGGKAARLSSQFKLLAYAVADESMRDEILSVFGDKRSLDGSTVPLYSALKEGLSRDDILSGENDDLRQNLTKALFEIEDLPKEEVRAWIDGRRRDIELKKHLAALEKAQREGNREVVDRELMEIQRIKADSGQERGDGHG
jgi:DNA primase